MDQRIRKTFRRWNLFMPLLRPTDLTSRMNAEQMADNNIELGRIARARELGPVLDSITVPARYVVAAPAGADAVREVAGLDRDRR
ncbi:hypothetical protein [Streptomyces sp. 3213.3]|uniref:hypothetical protein n=1 Tax=Streptomyces sp. 3213.3 TaxID=1855348 RepID=UPI001F42D26A|nr:hypothetical protein [Streptomyces sp. 3213.3]